MCLSNPSASDISVNYATSDDTAKANLDYTATSGTLTIGGGMTSNTFPVSIHEDLFDEPDGTENLALSNPHNASLGSPATAILIITDNDTSPSVFFTGAPYELSEDAGMLNITVNLSDPWLYSNGKYGYFQWHCFCWL